MRRNGLALALFSAWATGAEGAESWIEVKSPHFTLVSNAGERRARGTVWELEQARAAFAKLWPWAKLASGRATVVIAARDEATLKRWLPRYWEVKGGVRPVSTGAFGADRQYLLLRLDTTPTDSREVTQYFTLYRAYVSALIASNLERPLPVWLSIGLAEVYGNTSVAGKEIHVGQVVPWYLREFREHSRRPLGEILAAGRDASLVQKDDDRRTFDAQCWALVHYLTFGDEGARGKELNHFIQLLLAGRSPDVAWAEVFGDVRAVESKLLTYASKPLFPYGRLLVDVNIERERLPARTLSPAESAALQASVHVAMGRPEEAQAAIQEARTTDPKCPLSFDAEGLLGDRERDGARAAQAYRQAVQLGSTSPYTYYRAAQLTWKPSPDAETLATIRKDLERAIELNATYAPAYAYLASVMVEQDQAAAALPLAQRALALEPGNASSRITLARVHHQLGACAFAGWLFDGGRGVAKDPARAASFEQRACAAGDKPTCARHAWRQANGEGVPRNEAQATATLTSLCAEKVFAACTPLAMLHARKPGARDRARARELLAMACEGGDATACGLAKAMPR